jgi:oleandomycin transport system ATP-binding protein
MTSNLAVQLDGVVKRFGSTTALDGVSLDIAAGTVLGLLGPNGAGKTTVVRILATLLRPDAGTARVLGHDVTRTPAEVRAVLALTGQYTAVDENLTGVENLVLIARLLGESRRRSRRHAGELLELFGLATAGARPAKTYSGGMRRRLDLAAGLVGRPRVLCLDEPSTGLDPRARAELWRLIREQVADGLTVLLTTQYLDEADQLADRIAVVDHGRVIADGTPAELKAQTAGGTIELLPRHAEQAELAQALLTGVAGAPAERTDDRITAPVADTGLLAGLVRQLDAAGVEVAELTLRRPSLDEVFLSLTGAGR